MALLNHSCTPSAVVVFPSYHTPANPKPMRVVAIRPIAAGEEILTSYVDLGLPLRKRRAELRERYYFECDCALCMRRREEWVDPREAFKCVKKDCSGLVRMPGESCRSLAARLQLTPRLPDVELQTGDVEDGCSKCGSLRQTNVEQLKTTIASAEAELARAESQQYTGTALNSITTRRVAH